MTPTPYRDAINVENLAKTFRLGFLRRRVDAVRGVSFDVQRGEIFGLLGPNGAGKTTTLKMLMGLIFPSAGRARILGQPVGSLEAKRRIGYLPESPYFYDYLSPSEFLDFVGALGGLERGHARRQRDALIERVGLGSARSRRLRTFSKGMLQRVGIAQALMGEPELVILDEPMTGLDPVGRKEIRDLIVDLKDEGKTVLVCSHILHDVELVCDRVAIVSQGTVRAVGALGDLLSARIVSTEVVVDSNDPSRLSQPPGGARVRHLHGRTQFELPADSDVNAFVKNVLATGGRLISVTPRRESLEDLFVRETAASTGSESLQSARAAQIRKEDLSP